MFFTLCLYISLVGLLSAKEIPIKGSVEESKTKKWEIIRCRGGTECPRMIKRQHDGYADVCFLGNRDWYKLTWMSVINHNKDKTPSPTISHKNQMNEARKFAKKFSTKSQYYQKVFELNKKNMLFPSGIQTFMANMFHVSDNKYQMELFLLKPILRAGDFQAPCNSAILSFFRRVETCEELRNGFFSRTHKASKCYYVLDSSQSEKKQEELRKKLSLGNDQEMVVVLFDKGFISNMKWYKTDEDLCKDHHYYDEE